MKTLLIFSALCLFSSVEGAGRRRFSDLQNFEAFYGFHDLPPLEEAPAIAVEEPNNFRLEQSADNYDGYKPPVKPFTSTSRYLNIDAFFIGLSLDELYLWSDQCLDSLVLTIDDFAYLKINISSQPDFIHPLLNATGILAGNFSYAIPFCYQFGDDVWQVESERFASYESFGEIAIAFLFNQMGNALEFQQAFENIQLDKETQNYRGVYMEYGRLLHAIWDFQQLETAQYAEANALIAKFLSDLNLFSDPIENYIATNFLQRMAAYFDLTADVAANKASSFIDGQIVAPSVSAIKELKQQNQFNPSVDTTRLIYGFLNGAVDVFPFNSTMDLCRDNVTQSVDVFSNIFLNSPYTFPEDNLLWVLDFAELMTFPYGLTFSCMFGAQQIFRFETRVQDTTGMTEEEIRRNNQIIVNSVITNFIFNLGFIYQDIVGALELDGANLNYWSNLGYLGGDLAMRFFYREQYAESFQYDLIDDCDTTRYECPE